MTQFGMCFLLGRGAEKSRLERWTTEVGFFFGCELVARVFGYSDFIPGRCECSTHFLHNRT